MCSKCEEVPLSPLTGPHTGRREAAARNCNTDLPLSALPVSTRGALRGQQSTGFMTKGGRNNRHIFRFSTELK